MQTRWMLYLEDGETLKLLSGVPRKWLEDGKSIKVVSIRIPHPEGKKPLNVFGGKYDSNNESVIINPFNGKANIRIEY